VFDVQWNGAPLATTMNTNTQVQAAVPAANLTAAATVSVTVVNPASEGGASAAASFTVTPQVTAKVVKLVSTNYQTGHASNATSNNSPPTVSQDGRYVGYNSSASDIVAGVTSIGYNDGYLADTCLGTSAPTGCVPSNTRMVVNSNSPFQNGTAYRVVSVSSDGRYVGYGTGIQEVDVRDTCVGAAAGCTQTTTEVSEVPAVGFTTTSDCCSRMSPDGRYVLYNKFYSNPDTTSTLAVYVRDNCFGAAAGCTTKITRVAAGKGDTPVLRPAMFDISAGGRYILFGASTAEVDPSQPNPVNARNVWLQDTCIGAPAGCTVSYTMIDVRADGTASVGTGANDAVADESPSFSKDGRYVVFSTTDKNMITGRTINNGSQVYLRDTCVGAPAGCVASTTLVSDSPTLAIDSTTAFLGYRSVSEHGRYVAFLRRGLDATNYYITSVQVRDTCIGAPAGCIPSTSTPSSDPDNIVGLTHISYFFPSISADGHYVAFMSGIGTASGNGQIYLASTGY
jgi:trimeric autotransporter adhesin